MKLMLVSTSGGHFSTMRSLEPFWSSHERVWVTDRKKDTEVLVDRESVHWLPYQAPRDTIALLRNIPTAFQLIAAEKPTLVVSTGASIAISFGVAAKMLGTRFVYIESISRSQDLSLSGKIVYRFCDDFYVQWPSLSDKYPKAVFRGYV